LGEFISLIKGKQGFRVRLLIIFLVLVYIPMALNIYFIYNRTLKAVEEDKLKDAEQILKKTSESINFTFISVETDILKITEQNGIKKGLEDFNKLEYTFQEKIEKFIRTRAEEIKENNYYIESIICITSNGRVMDLGNNIPINNNSFFDSALYKRVITSRSPVWEYIEADIIFKNTDAQHKMVLASPIASVDGQKIVGYLFAIINEDTFKGLYSDISIGKTGSLGIYDSKERPIFEGIDNTIPYEKYNSLLENKILDKMERVYAQGKEYFIGVSGLIPANWKIYTMVPARELTESVENNLKRSLKIIVIIGALLGIWIIIHLVILTKVITEKEMAHYRLVLSEEMNSKLREYKHDFMNHLQIIRGLIELNRPDKALEYLQNTTKEGLRINDKFQIGIPELESAIFSAITECKEYNIDVQVESIRLPEKLPLEVYDLIKILSNLIKNAIQALKEADSLEKILSIKIYDELDEFVFKISNNTPIIPENHREDIFKKGFSTKDGKGRGYGLYIAKKVTERNNGHLELKVDEKGNHFIIRFPYYS